MRRDLLIITTALLVVVAVTAAGCLSSGVTRADILSVSTDKDLYHSNEVMQISLNVTSQAPLDNVLLRIEGFEDRYGNLHVSREIMVNLTPGNTLFTESFRLPACSSCAGLKAGTYAINVTIEKDGRVLDAMSHEVGLQQ